MRRRRLHTPIRYRSNDYDVVRSLVRAGLGVAAVPRLAYLGRVGLRDLDVTGLHLRRTSRPSRWPTATAAPSQAWSTPRASAQAT